MFRREPLAIWLLIAAGLCAVSARAAGLDTYQGVTVSNARITGLAGAFVGVAEGQDGEVYNSASLAHRQRTLNRGWDWDFVYTVQVDRRDGTTTSDFDNDGVRDTGLSERSAFQVGISLQIGRFGIGLLLDSLTLTGVESSSLSSPLAVVTMALSVGMAFAFWHEQLLVGAELLANNTALGGPFVATPMDATADFLSWRVRPSVLWRPDGARFRVGVQFDAGATVHSDQVPEIEAGLWRPEEITYPTVVRVGAAAWLGPLSHRFNERPLKVRRELGVPDQDLSPGEWPPVLVSAQLDVVGTSPNAFTMTSFASQQSGAPLTPGGNRVTVAPRLGAEWEPIGTWLVIRGGSYLEPSRSHIHRPRLHGTFGADVRIPLYLLNARASIAGDVAAAYSHVVLSLGLWHELGPFQEP